MNIRRKALGLGATVAILASLITAPAVFAADPSVTASGAGSFPQGGFEQSIFSAGASYTFNEGSVDGWGDTNVGAAGDGFVLDIIIATAGVHFDTTVAPTISGPGTLGLSGGGAFISDTDFRITAASSDTTVQEAFTVSGFMAAATTTAATGTVSTRYTYTPAGGANQPLFGGGFTVVATGTLAAAHGLGDATGATTVNTAGTFTNSAAGTTLVVDKGATNEETLTVWTAGALSGGTQLLTITTPANWAKGHLINAPIEERTATSADFFLPSIGSVVAAAALTAVKTNVLPGETNQSFGATKICENNNRDFATDAIVTITIQGTGVLFSMSPVAAITTTAGAAPITLASATSTLSFDRLSATWKVTAKDADTTTKSCITITGKYDVAASVAVGTKIKVAVTVGSLPSVPATVQNAVVGNAIVGEVLSVPTVFIGENDQPTGTIKITEAALGSFTQGPGINTIVVCLEFRNQGDDPLYTRAPWAVVGAGTDLLLRDPATLTGKASVMGEVPNPNPCAAGRAYSWRIFAKSTTAPATIYLVGSDSAGAPLPITGLANGPRISLSQGVVPGPVVFDLLEGDANGLSQFALFNGANAVYRNSPAVVATSNPLIARGGIGQPGGDVKVSETAAGQFQNGELVRISVLRNSQTERQEQFFTGGTGGVATTDFKVVTTGSGLVAHIAAVSNISVDVCIDQRAFQPTLGVLTVSGFKYTTVADATNGNVLLEVTATQTIVGEGFCVAGPGVTVGPAGARLIDVFVSNAHVGSPIAGTAKTRLGVTQTGAFTTSTKLPHVNGYVTYRFDFGVGAAGAHFAIWGATKTGNDWSAFTKITTRVANASGVVYYYIRQGAPTWKSYRAAWTEGGVLTPARQAHWLP